MWEVYKKSPWWKFEQTIASCF